MMSSYVKVDEKISKNLICVNILMRQGEASSEGFVLLC